MNHQEVRKHLAEGIDTKENSPLCIAVKSHLALCSDCRVYLASLERTIECYRSYEVKLPLRAHDLLERTLHNLSKK